MAPVTLIGRGPHYQSWEVIVEMPGVAINPYVLLRAPQLQALQATFAEGRTLTVEALVGGFSAQLRPHVLRSLHWLIKVGLLSIVHEKDSRPITKAAVPPYSRIPKVT